MVIFLNLVNKRTLYHILYISMSVTELSDLQFSTKEDPFWASVSFDQLEDEEFILEQYHKLQKNAEVGSNEEHEARLKE